MVAAIIVGGLASVANVAAIVPGVSSVAFLDSLAAVGRDVVGRSDAGRGAIGAATCCCRGKSGRDGGRG